MKLLKHKNNTDVAIAVLHSYYNSKTLKIHLRVMWFNIVNPNNVFDMGLGIKTLKINTDKILDWELYE